MANFCILVCFCAFAVLCSSLETAVKSLHDESTPLANRTAKTSLSHYLPPGWDEFCKLQEESTDKVKHYFCDIQIRHSGKWNFFTLKKHITEKTVKYKFDIHCENQANISVQWPLKAKNIVHLEIKNCKLEHYLRGHSSKTPTNISDELEHLHFEDCMVIMDIMDMLNIAGNISDLDKDYDCGHEETLKYYAYKNNSYEFGRSMEQFLESMFNNNASSMSAEIINKGSEMLSKSRLIKHKCIYKKLEYADLSVNRQTSKFHSELITENSDFPSLRVFNLSDNLMPNLPDVYKKWFRYFEKLEVMDLSHNYFTELEFDPSAEAWNKPVLRMNMSYNKISELKVSKLEELINMKKLFIDFSHNPLNCTCTEETKQLITFVNDKSKWSQPNYQRYAFMMDLECVYPEEIEGKRLADLKTKDLICKLDLLEKIAVEAVVFLSLLSVILIIVIIILLKFRREIRILTYTRFNIILPCQPIETYENKKFDAFVSYSKNDQEWVTRVFENVPTNSPLSHFRFCLHHKDFMPGKPIFDNVIDCVEASRQFSKQSLLYVRISCGLSTKHLREKKTFGGYYNGGYSYE